MAITEGLFWTEDGERLFYRFQPASPHAKNPIILIHGHGDHSGRSLKFFDRLKDLDYPIAAFDLRGCGQSSGRRVYVSRFEDYLNDVSNFLDFLGKQFQISVPISLFGHSLGGLIATAWARQNQDRISKLILSSPLFGIPGAGMVQGLVQFLNLCCPALMIPNPVNPLFLTHEASEIQRYRADPLIQRRITVRLVHEMLRYISIFEREEVSLACPIAVLMAEKDYIVDPRATRRFFEKLEAKRKTLEVFDGFYHEIFNEIGQDQAFEKLRYYLTH